MVLKKAMKIKHKTINVDMVDINFHLSLLHLFLFSTARGQKCWMTDQLERK